jgi:glycosyltransferase involved in cell wall biosynthesis
MNSAPTFSVVIPCYNYGHYLANALDSVLAQERSDVQVLLVDDASEDNTSEIAKKYQDIQYIRNRQNLGAGGAWCAGLSLAEGRFVIKLDADDELLPGHLDAIKHAFDSDYEVAIVAASVFKKKEPGDVLEPEYLTDGDQTLSPMEFRTRLLEEFFFRMPGCALRREVLIGQDGPDPELFQIHDWEYFLRVTKGHKAILLKSPSAIYRIHEASITAVAKEENRLLKDIKRWLVIAGLPGDRQIKKGEMKILRGSFSRLLLGKFGSRLSPCAYLDYVVIYFKAFSIASRGGVSQLARMHFLLLQKISRLLGFSS